MSLVKRTYVDQETVITAENLNAIQDAIIENEEAIEDQGEAIEGKYSKPAGGIPATDMASGVQTSLGKADSAYQKPSGGIPASDMASGVQTSLEKADTALQSSDIDGTLSEAGKAADAKKTGDELTDLRNTLNHKADMIYDTASGDIASFPDGADGLPVKDLTVGIEPVQSGTGDPSPTNVRPISGWTGCNVTRTGVNAWDEETQAGYYIIDTGQYVANPGQLCSKNFTPVKPNMQYLFRKTHNLGDILYYSLSKELIGSAINRSANYVFTTPENCYFIKMNLGSNYGSTYNHDIGINYPSTDTAYHAYTGVTLPISWQSSAGTVYGGTLDVTSGVLTVDRAMVDLGDMTWAYASGSGGYLRSDSITDIKLGDDLPTLCSIYPRSFASSLSKAPDHCFLLDGERQRIYVKDSDYTNGDVFKTAMNGQKMVYPLTSPTSTTLTPTEIETLLGQNNIWADTGDSTVEYPCDTKLYIQKINAPSDDDMIADAQIASGKYFIVNNNLYLSTTTILAGDPIKPGTNCTLTNLAAALNALNS